MEKLYSAYWQGQRFTMMVGKNEVDAIGNFIFDDFRKDRSPRPMKSLHLTAINN